MPAKAEEALSAAQKEAVQAVVKEYLKENPEAILESLEGYRQKKQQEMQAEAGKNIEKHLDFLTSADAPSIGNPKASVTVVEYIDFNCGYCKRALVDVIDVVKNDPDVRIVFHEMPILSAESLMASQWALAAHKQGKYFDFHKALMQQRGQLTIAALKRMAEETGLDPAQMEKDAASDTVKDTLDKSVSVARDIGIQGTPAFVINGELFPGYLGEGGLKEAIENARKKG
ncbi:MAG: DsbA family protein [Alphaproteobacteria bacterium]|nr:DsbA family protein [Alphaproteobacteria bacterium]